ncbi:hypothetical protein RR42_m3561 [Cupriavidus basilensis]|uniref:Uncharacterized protein n=1 Tax=Cupriavidus basilensis TaxID=68895 RepID=A0A0C4Y674_9BURK|nr:hypothetical protein RR42_m3561 [Cupriavidus basilensis]
MSDEEIATYKPKIILLDDNNAIKEIKKVQADEDIAPGANVGAMPASGMRFSDLAVPSPPG